MALCLQQWKIRRAVTTGKSVFSRQPHSSSWCDVNQVAIFMKQVEHKWQGDCITAWAPRGVGALQNTCLGRDKSLRSLPCWSFHQLWGWLLTRSKVCLMLPSGESKLCLAEHVQGPLAAITCPSFAIWPFSSFSGKCSQEGRSCPVGVWGRDQDQGLGSPPGRSSSLSSPRRSPEPPFPEGLPSPRDPAVHAPSLPQVSRLGNLLSYFSGPRDGGGTPLREPPAGKPKCPP